MAMFPESIYRLTPRDLQVTQLENVQITLSGTSGAADGGKWSTNTYTVPKGKVLLLEHCMLDFQGPAALALVPRWMQLCADYSAIPQFCLQKIVGTGATSSDGTYKHWIPNVPAPISFPVCLMEQINVHAQASLSGVAEAGWVLTAYIKGLLIPRGNFAV